MIKNLLIIVLIFFTALIYACNSSNADTTDEDVSPEDAVTPVTITHPTHGNLSETVELNAISSFTFKTFVKANTIGYLQTSGFHHKNKRSCCIR